MTKSLQRGFTLIELIIFIVVVSIGLAGILLVMNTVVKSSADPMVRKQTIAVAESLLEEILLKDYSSPSGGTNVGLTCSAASLPRVNWDNVCDYKGYTTAVCTSGCPGSSLTPVGCGIVDMIGNQVVSLCKYNISAVAVVLAPKATGTDLNNVEYKKVTVTVTGPGGPVSLTGYRTCDLSPSCPLP